MYYIYDLSFTFYGLILNVYNIMLKFSTPSKNVVSGFFFNETNADCVSGNIDYISPLGRINYPPLLVRKYLLSLERICSLGIILGHPFVHSVKLHVHYLLKVINK